MHKQLIQFLDAVLIPFERIVGVFLGVLKIRSRLRSILSGSAGEVGLWERRIDFGISDFEAVVFDVTEGSNFHRRGPHYAKAGKPALKIWEVEQIRPLFLVV